MKQNKKWMTLILAGLLIGSLGSLFPGYSEVVRQAKPAKDFSLKDLSSKKVSLSDFRGKVVLLNFFATWCPPCRLEIPNKKRKETW